MPHVRDITLIGSSNLSYSRSNPSRQSVPDEGFLGIPRGLCPGHCVDVGGCWIGTRNLSNTQTLPDCVLWISSNGRVRRRVTSKNEQTRDVHLTVSVPLPRKCIYVHSVASRFYNTSSHRFLLHSGHRYPGDACFWSALPVILILVLRRHDTNSTALMSFFCHFVHSSLSYID